MRLRKLAGGISVRALIIAEIALLVGPLVVTLILSFSATSGLNFPPHGWSDKWYVAVASDPQWRQSALLSLQAAALVTVVSSVLGLLASYALIRGRVPGRTVLTGYFLLPLVTPTMILALGLALVLTAWGLSGTLLGLVFGQSVLALPFVIVNVSVSLRAVDRNLELAAQSLGAHPFRSFLVITLPLIKRGIAAGAVFAFLASWDNAIVALFLTGPGFQTLPIQLLDTVQDFINPSVAAVTGYLTLVALAAVIGVFVVGRGFPTRATSRRGDERS